MRKKIFKIFSAIIIIAILASSLTGLTSCGDNDEDVILIGVLAPLSGTESAYGKDMLNSYKLAVEEINAAGGVLGKKLKLYEQDDEANPTVATTAASKIISKGVDFVVGGYASGAITPTMQMFYDEELLLLISCANSTKITEKGLNQSFMINSPGTHAVVTLTELLRYVGAKNIALVHQGDDYSQNLADLCIEGIPKDEFNIVAVELTAKDEPDVSAIVTNIKNSGADFVYWCGYHADGSNLIKQLRRGGYEGTICVGDGSADVDLIVACGADGEGVYATSPPFVKFSEGGQKFFDDYKNKFNREPGTYATLAYDTIYLLKAAIEKANSIETAAVRDAVQNIEFKGLSGLIKFTPDREPALSNFMILQIKDGDFTLVTP